MERKRFIRQGQVHGGSDELENTKGLWASMVLDLNKLGSLVRRDSNRRASDLD